MHEDQLIQLARSFPQFHSQHSLGIGDDAALIRSASGYQVWAVDSLVMGTHFHPDMPANAVGWKSLAVNLSDLAAMNAEPRGALLSLGLSEDIPAHWVQDYFAGLQRACESFCVDLLGGDTVSQAQGVHISISVLGESSRPWRRDSAQIGDRVLLSGPTGLAAAGLHCWEQNIHAPELQAAQLYPQPRLDLLETVQDFEIHGALDISDGLARSLELLCQSAQAGCEIDAALIPVSPHLKGFSESQIWQWILNGGEDYELLLSCAPEQAAALCATAQCVDIGRLTASPEGSIQNIPQRGSLKLWGAQKHSWGHQHFRG